MNLEEYKEMAGTRKKLRISVGKHSRHLILSNQKEGTGAVVSFQMEV